MIEDCDAANLSDVVSRSNVPLTDAIIHVVLEFLCNRITEYKMHWVRCDIRWTIYVARINEHRSRPQYTSTTLDVLRSLTSTDRRLATKWLKVPYKQRLHNPVLLTTPDSTWWRLHETATPSSSTRSVYSYPYPSPVAVFYGASWAFYITSFQNSATQTPSTKPSSSTLSCNMCEPCFDKLNDISTSTSSKQVLTTVTASCCWSHYRLVYIHNAKTQAK